MNGKRPVWTLPWTLHSWKACQKTTSAGNITANRGSLGALGGRGKDFSDMVAFKMAKKKAKEQRDRERARDKTEKNRFKSRGCLLFLFWFSYLLLLLPAAMPRL